MTTPTRDIDAGAPRIGSKAELVERLESGNKPAAAWRIGTEHEKFGFVLDTHDPLPYDGEGASVHAMLSGMGERFGWDGIFEGGVLIGLKRDGASVSLEPGGQYELSGAPLETIHQTERELLTHLEECLAVARTAGVGFLTTAFSPVWSLEGTPSMPKGRYAIMRRYMDRVGRLGRQMMYRSCTVQANLDFASEADMVRKMRVSLALQPVATALFANSPFAEGRPNGFLSYRAHVWSDTDPDRTGMLPFAFEDGFGFERYVDFALDVPMYFVRRNGRYIDCAGQSFRDFMEGRLPALPGEQPAMDDFDDHLSTIFPEVRLKTFLEMRGADSGPLPMLSALPAFWAGILYDGSALDAAWDLVKDWTAPEREALRRSVPMLGLRAPFRNQSMGEIADRVLDIAEAGLRARNRCDAEGRDETRHLEPLREIASSRTTQAERWLARYRGGWGGDIDHIFREAAWA